MIYEKASSKPKKAPRAKAENSRVNFHAKACYRLAQISFIRACESTEPSEREREKEKQHVKQGLNDFIFLFD